MGKKRSREVETDGEWLFLGRLAELDDRALYLTLDEAVRLHSVDVGSDLASTASNNTSTAQYQCVPYIVQPDSGVVFKIWAAVTDIHMLSTCLLQVVKVENQR